MGISESHEWLFHKKFVILLCGQLKAFPQVGVFVGFYSLGIVYTIKLSFGKVFSPNNVFLGSVSSLHSHRSNDMRNVCSFPNKAEIS